VAAVLISSRLSAFCSGRSLFVIADGGAEGVWRAFLNASLKDAQRHVLLLVGEHEHRSIGGVGVGRMSVDALASRSCRRRWTGDPSNVSAWRPSAPTASLVDFPLALAGMERTSRAATVHEPTWCVACR
jgi:hypothetical protein